MKLLRPLSFSLMGIVILLLIAGSVTEQIAGTDAAVKYVYSAPWTICIWAAAVLTGLMYMFLVKMYKHIITCLLHFSFVVILGGALLTHLFGKQGELHLRYDSPATTKGIELPFEVKLSNFHIDYYPGTNAPMDFVSDIEAEGVSGQVSMNNIFSHRHYRFYQAMFDTDMQGVTLRVSHDPWGIGVTYTGYALLLISICLFFFQKSTHFRELIKKLQATGATATIKTLLIITAITCFNSQVANSQTAGKKLPPTLYKPTAQEFCNMYVYYNDRVCPLTTLANDFTTKIYGKPSYKGLSAEEVLCGWLFYYDQWAKEPCIKIKGKETRRLLGIEGKYACLNDFTGKGLYKLDEALRSGDKNAKAADEKFQLISMVATASMLKIYPIPAKEVTDDKLPVTGDNNPTWYSWVDHMPKHITEEDWQFVMGSMEYVSLCIARNANTEAQDALRKIRAWQESHAGEQNLPSTARFKAEKFYYSANYTRPLAMAFATIGLVLFFVCCLLIAKGKRLNTWINFTFIGLMAALFLYLTMLLTLRWVISGHVPLSNGHETMQFLAWLSAQMTVILTIRGIYKEYNTRSLTQPNFQLLLPFGYLICGMTLMVSMMSQSNPQITNLMPVLQSPLLTMHVAVIMIAYCLLAFVMLNGIAAFFLKDSREQLQVISRILLYPAIFCLTIGIFLGAVWANISWGRYWGWDPKEVWALITMLVYSAMLHTGSIRFLQKPLAFHIYSVVAFLFVLFTYFGVNFVLGGLHSYA